ncbi:MAG TPA: hypothetical protein VJ246_03930 [Patescibacteria group bacterium]|nr:hypothetical protein [Patescibacteria group bacterium]
MVDIGEQNQAPGRGEGVRAMTTDELERLNPLELQNVAHGVGRTYEQLQQAFPREELDRIKNEAMQIVGRLEFAKVSKKK